MPRLVTVSGRRIELYPDREYIVGRDPGCDVVVEDCSCSRRHLKLSVDTLGNRVSLEDLESRNGTYLNGRRVLGTVAVPDGAQIHAGSTIFLFTNDEAELPNRETRDMCGADTMFIEAQMDSAHPDETRLEDSGPTGIKGKLTSVNFLDVIQFLTQMKSGTLHLELTDGKGRVEFRSGSVVAACFGDETGLAAIHALAGQKRGRFQFYETDAPCKRNIDLPTPNLLLEICRVLDESGSVGDPAVEESPVER